MSEPGNLLIRDAKVLRPDGKCDKAQVLIEQGRISAIDQKISRATTTLDVDGAYVVPGLIDLHLHGIGYESAETSLEDFAAMEARNGATAFMPALFSPPRHTAELMRRQRQATDELRSVPQVIGFRLESPYLHHAGGGLGDDLAPISDETTDMLLEAAGPHLKIWDIAPDLDNAIPLIKRLSKAGIVCSMAHTCATIEQARAATDAGMRMVTHLFDTFASPETRPPGVYPVALTDYLLVEDRLTCEIIPDGTHVHPLLVEKTFRCKPQGRLLFVTDSQNGAGLEPGEYDLPRGWGRVRIEGPNDGVRLIERNVLCGSALTPIACFRNAIRMFGRDMAAAARICAETPAQVLGLNKGRIEPGRDADMLVLSPEYDILYTIAAGRIVYRH
ncbi:MAG: N-acetylglucosamine-6-phosphate deacetylase [Kiritimatiellia bacterium]|nr:amidohydrolase family protein [Lentisphaerota bacterium]